MLLPLCGALIDLLVTYSLILSRAVAYKALRDLAFLVL